jgi:hypothetical protein
VREPRAPRNAISSNERPSLREQVEPGPGVRHRIERERRGEQRAGPTAEPRELTIDEAGERLEIRLTARLHDEGQR